MVKANVTLKERKIDTAATTILFEAADLETIKNAVAQWVVNEMRIKKQYYDVVSINPLTS